MFSQKIWHQGPHLQECAFWPTLIYQVYCVSCASENSQSEGKNAWTLNIPHLLAIHPKQFTLRKHFWEMAFRVHVFIAVLNGCHWRKLLKFFGHRKKVTIWECFARRCLTLEDYVLCLLLNHLENTTEHQVLGNSHNKG